MQPSLAIVLGENGFRVDLEDGGELLKERMPVWRSKDTDCVEPTARRRKMDIVAYRDERLVAIVEIESDLNDLRETGVTRRNGHYDVWSIAKSSKGSYFDSYKSLERMAAAAYYLHLSIASGFYPSEDDAVGRLEAVVSDDPTDHNPTGIALFLVSGRCRPIDRAILTPRLESLGARLFCAKTV